MMTLPFFAFAAGLGAIWTGRRIWAVALWAAGMLITLTLFRIHVTSSLGLGL